MVEGRRVSARQQKRQQEVEEQKRVAEEKAAARAAAAAATKQKKAAEAAKASAASNKKVVKKKRGRPVGSGKAASTKAASNASASMSPSKKKKRRIDVEVESRMDHNEAGEALLGLQTPSPVRRTAKRSMAMPVPNDSPLGSLLTAVSRETTMDMSRYTRRPRKPARPPPPSSNPFGIVTTIPTSPSRPGRRASATSAGGKRAKSAAEVAFDPADVPSHMSKETYQALYARTLNSLTPKHRQFALCEWFYPNIDKNYFAHSDFADELKELGLEHVSKLTRTEWSYVRSLMGKTRRFSPAFIAEERAKLYQNRARIRIHHASRVGSGNGTKTEELEKLEGAHKIPPALTVGQAVMARHPRTMSVHRGSILTIDHQACNARVQFQAPELGTALLPDEHIASLEEPKAENEASTANPDAVTNPSTFLKTGYSRADIMALSNLRQLLERKEAILELLKEMHSHAERITASGHAPPSLFQRQYAWLVIQLDSTNRALMPALVRVRAVPRITNTPRTPAPPKEIKELGSVDKASTSEAVKPEQSGKDLDADKAVPSDSSFCTNLIETCRKTAKMMVASLSKKLQDEAKADKTGGQTEGDASWSAEDVLQTTALVEACVSLLLHVQACTDRVLSPTEVSWCLDSAVSALEPKSAANKPIFEEIKSSVGQIKTALRSAMTA